MGSEGLVLPLLLGCPELSLAALQPVSLHHSCGGSTASQPPAPAVLQNLFDRFAAATVKIGHFRIILPNGGELVYGERDPARVTLEVRLRRGRLPASIL